MPGWASTNLGIFICVRCCGVHRSLGTNISRVKSLTLDKWTPEEIAEMQSIGNERANAFWEAQLDPDFKRPSWDANEDVASFITAKYVQRRWAQKQKPKPKPKPKKDEESDDELPTFDLLTPVYD